ncbi:tetratricopeptide repeat protein [Flavobacterium sp. RSB2_4_14]|uniref:type IX secretion system periplasmic lipoprotein PorW/SprE n=1 Tax=Flavobacterium sp. RSB2_4_14 TaxID=3447665 RepID=UPI003F3AB9C8
MKTNTIKYLIFTGLLVFLIACSTKKNTFLSRNSHALSTKDNILYNGGMALDKGIEDVKLGNIDNFWERLPVERMQIKEDVMLPGDTKNANFERAETKATKAIQKHSMYIEGSEKNPQMDEAHLLLGKSRYYDQRFVPALEAFNYVLYKYPSSDKIYEVKIWREKTNMRLENDAIAVNNLTKLLKEIKFKDQIFADANATLAQAFLNLEEKDSAVSKLKIAIEYTKSNEEKSRYKFILGQLFEELKQKDSALAMYQSIIDMKRKAGREYVIHSHIRRAEYFDYEHGDTLAFINKYNELLKDRENRPFLDVLDHQMALFYDRKKNYKEAKAFYNYSLGDKSRDPYLVASNYRNLADIHFNSAEYVTAGKYYDSTLVQLKPRTREYNLIKKKRENLEDVIKYEGIAQRNDSIISLYGMSDSAKRIYFENYILDLKQQEEKLQMIAEKEAIIKENQEKNDGQIDSNISSSKNKPNTTLPPVSKPSSGSGGDFYFYNPTTVAYGKKEFLKNWGKRSLQDNWRVSSMSSKTNEDIAFEQEDKKGGKTEKDSVVVDERFSADFYISQIPTSQTVIDSLSKERNFAYYQLGVIYKEKFKEYQLAANKLERLLDFNPEERLVLPSMYNLYKIYEIIDKGKAEEMKSRIISEYPNSRYAQILNNPENEIADSSDSPKAVYESTYKKYQNGEFKEVLTATEQAIDRFAGDEIVPKFELLKANVVGKLSGLDEYAKALNFVSLNYPNSEEGKRAEKQLNVDIPKLMALQLSKNDSKNWKILYSTKDFEDKNTKILRDKIKKFIADRSLNKLSVSLDIYTMTDNFVVIHGINSEDLAKGIVSILKDYKDYKVQEKAIIISAENYTIVQIKKNLDEFLAGNLADNPPPPNWDGTIEKAPVAQQEKPAQNQEQTPANNSKKQDINQPKNPQKGMEENDSQFGLPPSPQMDKPGKK